MTKVSLYRRHRPQSFADVVGQEHVVRTLSNAIERDRVHHAYLFVGSRGTGKTSLAKILARSLNCVEGPTLTPCGECDSCREIAAGTSLDVAEMDAASNRSVDDIRELRERVNYSAAPGRWKVYILDEAHMLTREAWNAFLKTLEEPPPRTVFVLATTEAHKVMPTIVDRCQRFDFHRPAVEQIAEVVRRVAAAETLEVEPRAVAAISRAAAGSFRDALGTLDQLVAYGGSTITADDALAVLGIAELELVVEAAQAICEGDASAVLAVSGRLADAGRDVSQFGRDLLGYLRRLVVIRVAGELPEQALMEGADPERMAEQAELASELALTRAIDAISAALAAIRDGDEPRLALEIAMLRSARPQIDPSREAVRDRLERLERALGGEAPSGTGPAAEPPTPSAEPPTPSAAAPQGPTSSQGAAAPSSGSAGPRDTSQGAAPPAAVNAPAGDPPAEPRPGNDAGPAEEPAGDPALEPAGAPPHEPVGDPGPGPTGGPEPEPEMPPSSGPGTLDSPPAAAVPIDPDHVRERWEVLIEHLFAGGYGVVASLLREGQLVDVDPALPGCVLGVSAENAFVRTKLAERERRAEFAHATHELFGAELQIEVVELERSAGGEEPPPPDERELIERMIDELDASEVLTHEPSPDEEAA